MDQGSSLSFFTAFGEWLQQMNGILLVIGLCSVVAIAVFIERLKYLNEIDIDTETLLLELKSSIQQGNIVEAISLCETHEGAVSNIIKAGITSPYSLYSESIATFGKSDYNQKDAEGFINLYGLPVKVRAMMMAKKK